MADQIKEETGRNEFLFLLHQLVTNGEGIYQWYSTTLTY